MPLVLGSGEKKISKASFRSHRFHKHAGQQTSGFSMCGPWTNSISRMWQLGRNTNSWALLNQKLWGEAQQSVF